MEEMQIYENEELQQPAKINFDKFFEESIKKSEEKEKNTEYVNITFTTADSLLSIDYDKINEEELARLIKLYYPEILYSLMNYINCQYIELFAHKKFLHVLNQVLSQEQVIDFSNICYLNKLVYDYAVLQDKNDYIMGLYLQIARTINRVTISKLQGIGIPENIAVDIAICRYSNQDDIICTKRLTNKLVQQSSKLMTEKMLVDLYQILYDRMTPLFIGVMYDIYTEDELSAFGADASLINSTINLAVLDLLDSMTSTDIRKVLITYASTYCLNSNFEHVRFNLSSCPDYQRILEVISNLQLQEGIQLP